MLEFQNTSANEMTSLRNQLKTAEDEIATLRTQMATLKQFMTETQKTFLMGLHDRVDFLEKLNRYQHMMIKYQHIGKFYEEKNHVSGKIMARMWELGCIYSTSGESNISEYLGGHTGPDDDWLAWTTHATEEDLLNFITALYAMYSAPTVAYLTFTFPIVRVYLQVYTTGEYKHNYRKCMHNLKESKERWLTSWPSNMRNIPGKCKTFAEAYFTRVENVLTKLHEMNLLK
jgi:hypothetical protein